MMIWDNVHRMGCYLHSEIICCVPSKIQCICWPYRPLGPASQQKSSSSCVVYTDRTNSTQNYHQTKDKQTSCYDQHQRRPLHGHFSLEDSLVSHVLLALGWWTNQSVADVVKNELSLSRMESTWRLPLSLTRLRVTEGKRVIPARKRCSLSMASTLFSWD